VGGLALRKRKNQMSKEETKKPNKVKRKGALVALEYEVGMLGSLANVLATDNQGEGVIHNALLESFLIHARILIEFLYKNEAYRDTVIASQYFTDSQNILPPKTKLLEETAKDAHKYLAHLTYTRTRLEGKKQWLYIKIANDIKAVLQVFYKNLPDDFNTKSKI